jgi:serine protease Do
MTASLRTSLLSAVAAVGLIGTGAALRTGTSTAHATPALPTDGSIADVAERVVDSVVNISSSSESKSGPAQLDPFFTDPSSPFFGQMPGGRKSMAKGSGVIVTADGRILTNSHVVNGFTDIRVTLQDGTELDAKVVGKDPKADLAVLQLKGKFPPLKPIAFGDSSAARLGEVVLAVGDGMGVGKSVSMGIVSAKGRGGIGIEEYEDFIQTDAAINPGNSGGALVNLKGELIGINTAIASRSGGYQGIGFAIPTNMARPIMDMLVRDGKVARGYLGVNITTVSPAVLKEHKLGTTTGVVVAELQADGPAAKAGLQKDDVITGLNGVAMRSSEVLRNTIAMIKPGTTVDLEVIHSDGVKSNVKAKLGELPEQVAQDDEDVQQAPMQQQIQRWFMGPDGNWQQMPNQPQQPKQKRHHQRQP